MPDFVPENTSEFVDTSPVPDANAIERGDESSSREVSPEELIQLDFRVWGTKEQLMALRNYMKDNGLKFGKVE